MRYFVMMSVLATCISVGGCSQPSGTQIVLVGESNASGAEAANEVNLAIANADQAGCEAISVGGYAAGGEGLVIGIPVLLDCPQGTSLLPNGTVAP